MLSPKTSIDLTQTLTLTASSDLISMHSTMTIYQPLTLTLALALALALILALLMAELALILAQLWLF